jgi:hypothetical protein
MRPGAAVMAAGLHRKAEDLAALRRDRNGLIEYIRSSGARGVLLPHAEHAGWPIERRDCVWCVSRGDGRRGVTRRSCTFSSDGHLARNWLTILNL